MKKVGELIGLPSSQTGFETRGSVQGWKQTFLEDHLKTLAEQGEWDFFKTTLALPVTQGTNPVMAILADTLMPFGSLVTSLPRFQPHEIPEKNAQQWKNDFARYKGNTSLGGCIAYTPVIALRQLKWTQFVPDKELLGGVCFQYGTNNEQHERVRKAWEHIHKKGERELGKGTCICLSRVSRVENERRGDAIPVPMERKMRLIEEREDRAMTEIESLRNQCKKKDELIERQRMSVQMPIRVWQKGQGIGRNNQASTEKEDLEVRGQEKDQVIEQLQEDLQQAQAEVQMIEQLQEELRQAQAEAESHKTLARDYSIELMKTKKNECLLEVQVKELKIERDYLQREIKKLEPVELQKDIWKVRAEHEQEQKRKLMQTCEKMAEVTQDHVATLTARVREANEEIDSSPGMKLPWKIFKLVKFCQDVSRSFSGN
ncbi:hypothetical protein SESBI_07138 [Sesbania bispinosa]|nr:hypothetical protein SESBI_07138 [Sesbania bispinosa]